MGTASARGGLSGQSARNRRRFAKRAIPGGILLVLFICSLRVPAQNLTCMVVNHHPETVHADALVLDASAVYSALGVASGTPLSATLSGLGSIPILPETRNGTDVLLVFLSVDPNERAEIDLTPAGSWLSPSSVYDAQWNGSSGSISNGMLRARFDSGGIDLFFDGPLASAAESERTVIKSLYFLGWLDDKDSGSVYDPVALGLAKVDTRTAAISSANATIETEGPTLRLERTFTGLGANVQCAETLTLRPGLPLLRYHLLFTNTGGAPAWIAWANGVLVGQFGQAQTTLKTPYWLDNVFDLS
ncbi:hypothetical protein HQ520_18170, partial [bacterium]|nr:hypothetical protein [bacterium]